MVATGALALTVAMGAYPALGAGTLARPLLLAGGAAVLLVAAALAGVWRGGMAWAPALLGAEYLASLYLRGSRLDLAAAAYAVGLFAVAELGWLGVEGDRPWPGRALAAAVVAAAGAVTGYLLLTAAALPLPGGAPLTAAGVAAATVAALWLALLLRRAAA